MDSADEPLGERERHSQKWRCLAGSFDGELLRVRAAGHRGGDEGIGEASVQRQTLALPVLTLVLDALNCAVGPQLDGELSSDAVRLNDLAGHRAAVAGE